MNKISSVSEFIDSLKGLFSHLKDSGDFFTLWFRGEENAFRRTPLVPRAYRDFNAPVANESFNRQSYFAAKKMETDLKGIFRREATPFLIKSGIKRTAWNEYYL